MLDPAEQDHIAVGRTLGCQVELLDGGVCVLHPHLAMRPFNCRPCWSPEALPRLVQHAISCYRCHAHVPVFALYAWPEPLCSGAPGPDRPERTAFGGREDRPTSALAEIERGRYAVAHTIVTWREDLR